MVANLKVLLSCEREDEQTETAGQCDKDQGCTGTLREHRKEQTVRLGDSSRHLGEITWKEALNSAEETGNKIKGRW